MSILSSTNTGKSFFDFKWFAQAVFDFINNDKEPLYCYNGEMFATDRNNKIIDVECFTIQGSSISEAYVLDVLLYCKQKCNVQLDMTQGFHSNAYPYIEQSTLRLKTGADIDYLKSFEEFKRSCAAQKNKSQ